MGGEKIQFRIIDENVAAAADIESGFDLSSFVEDLHCRGHSRDKIPRFESWNRPSRGEKYVGVVSLREANRRNDPGFGRGDSGAESAEVSGDPRDQQRRQPDS